MVGDQQVGDDAGAAGFTFSFGGDGQAYFVAVVAERRTLIGLLLQTGDKLESGIGKRSVWIKDI